MGILKCIMVKCYLKTGADPVFGISCFLKRFPIHCGGVRAVTALYKEGRYLTENCRTGRQASP